MKGKKKLYHLFKPKLYKWLHKKITIMSFIWVTFVIYVNLLLRLIKKNSVQYLMNLITLSSVVFLCSASSGPISSRAVVTYWGSSGALPCSSSMSLSVFSPVTSSLLRRARARSRSQLPDEEKRKRVDVKIWKSWNTII